MPDKKNENKVNKNSCDVPGKYCTNITTCNKTLPDGSVVNVLEDNAELARNIVNFDTRL
jgi:hypothetical protein